MFLIWRIHYTSVTLVIYWVYVATACAPRVFLFVSADDILWFCVGLFYSYDGGRDSSVGIANCCGLGGPRIESRWGVRFSAPVQTDPGAYPASCTMGTGTFPGVKRPGRGADHPPSSQHRGWRKSRAIPLLTLWTSVACYGVNFILLLCF